jgi:hypothetical protein
VIAPVATKTNKQSKRKIFIRFLRKNGNDAAKFRSSPDC